MRALVAITATVVAMASGPSAAQLASGVSGSSGVRESGLDETWYTVREPGRCLVASKAVAADALVRTAPGSLAENAAFKTALGKSSICLRGSAWLANPRAGDDDTDRECAGTREVARIIPGLRDCFISADKFTTDATSFRPMWVEAVYLADTVGGV